MHLTSFKASIIVAAIIAIATTTSMLINVDFRGSALLRINS